MPTAYSYIRFSSEKQKKGHSVKRQEEMALKYIERNPHLDLELDTELNMKDLSVSGFKGKNLAEGALGNFVRLAYAGEIEKGSYLLVENLDRFSRDEAWKAVTSLMSLIQAGIVVITLSDESIYSEETMSGQDGTLKLMQSVLIFTRANDESAQKSRRVASAWNNKFKRISEGVQLTKRVPFWINPEDKNKTIKEKVAVVRRIFKLNSQGIGTTRIAGLFNQESLEPPTKHARDWNISTIKKVLKSKAVLGTLVAGDGNEYPNYYPAIIKEELWNKTRTLGISSKKVRESTEIHPLSGLTFCSRCGATAIRSGKTGRVRKDGTKNNWKTLVCSNSLKRVSCSYRSLSYNHILHSVNMALDQTALSGQGDKVSELKLELEFKYDELAEEMEIVEDLLRKNRHNITAKQAKASLLEKLEELRIRGEEISRMRRGFTVKQVENARNKIFSGEGINPNYRLVIKRVDIDFEEHFLKIELHDGAVADSWIQNRYGKYPSEDEIAL